MPTPLRASKSLAELQVECEVAKEVLAECFAFYAKQLSLEKLKDAVDQEKLDALEKRLMSFKGLQMEIGVERSDIVNDVLVTWAPLLRKNNL